MDIYSLVKDQFQEIVSEEIANKKTKIASYYYEKKKSLESVTLKSDDGQDKKKIIPTNIQFQDIDWTLFLTYINTVSEIEAKILIQQYIGTHTVSDEVLQYFGLNPSEVKEDSKYFEPNNVDTRFINNLRTKFNAEKQMP